MAFWAVQGCQFKVTAPDPAGQIQVVTPPLADVMVDNKPAYAGDVQVMVTGMNIPGTQVAPVMVTVKAFLCMGTKADNKPCLVMGDMSLGTEMGVFIVDKSTGATVTAPVIVAVMDAGQTDVDVK